MAIFVALGLLFGILVLAVAICFFCDVLQRMLYEKCGWFSSSELARIADEEEEIKSGGSSS